MFAYNFSGGVNFFTIFFYFFFSRELVACVAGVRGKEARTHEKNGGLGLGTWKACYKDPIFFISADASGC